MMKEPLKEADYKIATIEWLVDKGHINGDAVLINELPVNNFNRRADLVVANGKLHAFEIKSDADSLARLNGQIETYLSFFDKVTVVCSPKYTSKALRMLPDAVQILELNNNGEHNNIMKMVRRGKTKIITSSYNYLSFVEKKILRASLKKQGLPLSQRESRISMCKKLDSLPQKKWRDITLAYLKNKYKNTHDAFFSVKRENFTIDELILLSPQNTINIIEKIEKEDDITHFGINKKSLTNEKIDSIGIDISENLYKLGFNNSKPMRVIPKLKR